MLMIGYIYTIPVAKKNVYSHVFIYAAPMSLDVCKCFLYREIRSDEKTDCRIIMHSTIRCAPLLLLLLLLLLLWN